jgi:hypothetical protein
VTAPEQQIRVQALPHGLVEIVMTRGDALAMLGKLEPANEYEQGGPIHWIYRSLYNLLTGRAV